MRSALELAQALPWRLAEIVAFYATADTRDGVIEQCVILGDVGLLHRARAALGFSDSDARELLKIDAVSASVAAAGHLAMLGWILEVRDVPPKPYPDWPIITACTMAVRGGHRECARRLVAALSVGDLLKVAGALYNDDTCLGYFVREVAPAESCPGLISSLVLAGKCDLACWWAVNRETAKAATAELSQGALYNTKRAVEIAERAKLDLDDVIGLDHIRTVLAREDADALDWLAGRISKVQTLVYGLSFMPLTSTAAKFARRWLASRGVAAEN